VSVIGDAFLKRETVAAAPVKAHVEVRANGSATARPARPEKRARSNTIGLCDLGATHALRALKRA
jgi:hypothetical protein